MNPLELRRKSIALKITIEPEGSDEEVDQELKEEGKAPILKKVEQPEADDDMEMALLNGEEREIENKMSDGLKPKGLSERIQMDIMKKKRLAKA